MPQHFTAGKNRPSDAVLKKVSCPEVYVCLCACLCGCGCVVVLVLGGSGCTVSRSLLWGETGAPLLGKLPVARLLLLLFQFPRHGDSVFRSRSTLNGYRRYRYNKRYSIDPSPECSVPSLHSQVWKKNLDLTDRSSAQQVIIHESRR